MALVVICGQPCSGKSTAAACLADALRTAMDDAKPSVRIIDESSLHLGRNQSYADMTMEKNLRGVLRSEVDRSLSKNSIVIVDSLNNIKGYRYELWCLARAAGIRYCVVFCDTDEEKCREWNREREEMGESSYDMKIFEDLARRFETPDRRNRWDSPLFELFPSKDVIEVSSSAIADVVSYLTKKVDSKTRDVKVLQPTIATQSLSARYLLELMILNDFQPIKEERGNNGWKGANVNRVTKQWNNSDRLLTAWMTMGIGSDFSHARIKIQAHKTDANSLYAMDRATQEVINVIIEAQSQGLGGSMNRISLGQNLPTINIHRPVGLPELRSLRRTFIKLTGQTCLSGPPPPSDPDSAKRMFVDYLNREIGDV